MRYSIHKWTYLIVFLISLVGSSEAQVLGPVNWTALQGVSFDRAEETLIKTAPRAWGNSGGFSQKAFTNGEGEVWFQTDNLYTGYILGLSPNQSGLQLQDVKYGIWIDRTDIHIVSDNRYIGAFGRHKPHDVFQVKKIQGNIYILCIMVIPYSPQIAILLKLYMHMQYFMIAVLLSKKLWFHGMISLLSPLWPVWEMII